MLYVRGWPKLCACFTLNYRWVRMTAIQWPQPLCGIDLSTMLKFIPKMRIWSGKLVHTIENFFFSVWSTGNYVLLFWGWSGFMMINVVEHKSFSLFHFTKNWNSIFEFSFAIYNTELIVPEYTNHSNWWLIA